MKTEGFKCKENIPFEECSEIYGGVEIYGTLLSWIIFQITDMISDEPVIH